MSEIIGIELPMGFKILNPKSLNSWEGPYESIEDALSSIPISMRYPTMEIKILNQINGNNKYWFKDGIEDSDLISFNHNLIIDLSGETAERILNDNYILGLITGETSQVTQLYVDTQDEILNNLITGETNDRISGDINNYNLLTGLTSTILSNYNTLDNAITGETVNRISGDINNYNLLTGLTSTVSINYNTLNNLITGETVNRVTGDVTNYNLITGLTSTVSTNYDLITGETVNRVTGDVTNYNLITGETTNRIVADIDNYNLITGEIENRITNDVNNYNLITGLTSNVNDIQRGAYLLSEVNFTGGTITLNANIDTIIVNTLTSDNIITITQGTSIYGYSNEWLLQFETGPTIPTITFQPPLGVTYKWVGGIQPTMLIDSCYLLTVLKKSDTLYSINLIG